jgi:hypothetical protein
MARMIWVRVRKSKAGTGVGGASGRAGAVLPGRAHLAFATMGPEGGAAV